MQVVSFVSLISMKQRLSIFLGVLFLGLNNPEAKTAGCRFSVDPLTQVNVSITPYAYCANNPVNFIDPDGRNFTHYADRNYNILLQTNDGSNNVVMVPDEKIRDFKFFGNSYDKHSGMRTYYDSPGWNMHWVEEFGLAPRQLSEEEVSVLSLYHGNKAQNAAVGFMLKPTAGNMFETAGLEAWAQWRTPELLAGGISIGISALSSLSALQAAKGVLKYSDDLVKSAQKLYPNKAGKIELHHISPKYLGGAKNGAMVPLDGAYHQMITNEFRSIRSYGLGPVNEAYRLDIMKRVYSKFSLPPGYGF